jgi:hypothetical protein
MYVALIYWCICSSAITDIIDACAVTAAVVYVMFHVLCTVTLIHDAVLLLPHSDLLSFNYHSSLQRWMQRPLNVCSDQELCASQPAVVTIESQAIGL